MNNKKKVRSNFRESVFERDNHTCVTCGATNVVLDSHHITDRTEMVNGGYCKENGISLCSECHLKAEKFHISGGDEWDDGYHPNDLYKLIESSYELACKQSLKL